MTHPYDLLVDSEEGITYLLRWAKAHSIVLGEAHAALARKWGVSTDGVMINRPTPLTIEHDPKEKRP